MIKTFPVVNIGKPDAQGDVFAPNCIQNKSDRIPILLNFNISIGLISYTKSIEERDGKIYVTADIPESYLGMYPAIGFKCLQKQKQTDGLTKYNDIKLMCIGITHNLNVDPTIEKISAADENN